MTNVQERQLTITSPFLSGGIFSNAVSPCACTQSRASEIQLPVGYSRRVSSHILMPGVNRRTQSRPLGIGLARDAPKQPLRYNPALLGDGPRGLAGEGFNFLPLTSEVGGAKPGVNGR